MQIFSAFSTALDILPRCILSDKTCQMIPLCRFQGKGRARELKKRGFTSTGPRKSITVYYSWFQKRYNCIRNQLLLVGMVKKSNKRINFLAIEPLIPGRRGLYSLYWLTFVGGVDPPLRRQQYPTWPIIFCHNLFCPWDHARFPFTWKLIIYPSICEGWLSKNGSLGLN